MPRLSKIGAAALAAFGWTGLSSVTASYLQVAGGAGGGGAAWSGGGGAGGLLSGTVSLNPTESYTVTVGAGGSGGTTGNKGTNGSNSQFGILTASVGGGGGAAGDSANFDGNSGGSGGGGGSNFTGGSSTGTGGAGTSGQGNAGGNGGTDGVSFRAGGGGGGSGGVGGNNSSGTGGNGGAGTASSISGSSVTYAGGGGGAGNTANGTTTGGGGTAANPGTANTGGGGGGSVGTGSGGNGGAGVVIISYAGAQQFGGGVVTSSGGNTIHTFTISGTLSPLSSLTASYLIVAGGGGGAATAANGQSGGAGGGGAGGLLSGSSLTIDTNSIYAVTVGAGGLGSTTSAASGSNGSNSSFSMVSTAAVGGGGGACNGSNNGSAGGSGGGGYGFPLNTYNGGAGTAGQGNDGGRGHTDGVTYTTGGGGGGAGAAATQKTSNSGGDGGAGSASSISGTSTTYAGGGGGGGSGGAGGTGGSGGGGNGGAIGVNGSAGTANLGGGGGGAGGGNTPVFNGGNGGSGVVIISYPGSTQQMAGGTVTVAGGNVIHTFTSSGYLTPIVLVNNSLRFRSSASAYLNRTPSVASNRKTWTFSAWIKRGTLGSDVQILHCYDGSSSRRSSIQFNSDNTIGWDQGGSGTSGLIDTVAVYRDPSAWYHLVCVADYSNSTAANRALIYVNGVLQTVTTADDFDNADGLINSTNAHQIGSQGGSGNFFDGYMTDINFIDGQALTPNSFGTSNGLGVWQPIRYGGSYGTNGFYLPFTGQSSSLTASYLTVAGGGGGGGDVNTTGGGGGGAGGYLTGTTTLNTASSYTVTVGSGGAGGVGGSNAGAGNNSQFGTLTASVGGGFGSSVNGGNGGTGGSGGGGKQGDGSSVGLGGAGTSGQGNAGGFGLTWAAGGGGGASASGQNATGSNGASFTGGFGGAGTASSISGSSVTYAGGGGGGGGNGGSGGAAGAGGGAAGGNAGSNGNSASANLGGGGGGTGSGSGGTMTGGNGGSGVVIVSYSGSPKFAGGTITQSGGNTIHTFTSSGVLTNVFSDYSPNGNNWTGNNFDVTNTTASTYDSMTDVPTLTSATAANYSVLNPVSNLGNGAISGGNLNYVATTFGWVSAAGTTFVSSGKWYYEVTLTTFSGGGGAMIGVANTGFTAFNNYAGSTANSWSVQASESTTNKWNNNSSTLLATEVSGVGDVFMLAYDVDAGKVWFGRNGTWYSSGDPATGANAAFTNLTGTLGVVVSSISTTSAIAVNCGQRPFSYTPPTGFVALNTFNLPTPTIGATAATTANKYMNIALYTGTGSSQSITGLGFQPDWTWIKERNASADHGLYDAVRGVQIQLESNNTDAETTETTGLTAFGSDGFTVGALAQLNTSADTYVAWNWKANVAGSSNTAGSITSTVSANTTAGFSIVTYTGTGANGATIGHGLGVAPRMVIVKERGNANVWGVGSSSLTSWAYHLRLNSTNAESNADNFWNSTAPTSSVFTLGDVTGVNRSGGTYVAYCFAQIAGYSAFGSYTGNASTDGPFVFTGFRPRFVLYKNSSNGSAFWRIWDSSRSPNNEVNAALFPNASNAEDVGGAGPLDFLSNGFKIRTSQTNDNGSGNTFIYMAFAENPFKYSNAR